MYKTIRHGENSLQYTILPQSEDSRIEGKLPSGSASNTSSAISCAAQKCNKARRPKRRSFFAYLGLIFVCTVIVGAVLIPFLVSTECLSIPSEWFMKTKAAFTQRVVGSTHSNADSKDTRRPPVQSNAGVFSKGTIETGKKVKIFNNHGLEKIILKVSKPPSNESFPQNVSREKSDNFASTATTLLNRSWNNNELSNGKEADTEINLKDTFTDKNEIVNVKPNATARENFVAEVRFDKGHQIDVPDSVVPTIVVTTVRNQNNYEYNNGLSPQKARFKVHSATMLPTSQIVIGKVNTARDPKQISGISAISTAPARTIQVPLLKATAKKPIIPPVLVKLNSSILRNKSNESHYQIEANAINIMPTAISKSNTEQPSNLSSSNESNWINSHWPYIDPSTYFQWNNYKREDSVLLPALLGFALIGVILIIMVCLIVRNKRTIVTSVRKRNRNDIEVTGTEDNATLLTTTNLSDED